MSSRAWNAGPLAALGGAGFLAVFTWRDLALPLVVAAVVGVVAHWLAAEEPGAAPRRVALRRSAAVGVIAVGAVVALRASPLVLLDGVRQGPRDILGAALPAPAEPRSLAVPYLLTVAAAYLGARTTATGVRAGRGSLVPVVPSLVLLVAGLSFGGTDGLAGSRLVAPAWAGLVLLTMADVGGGAGPGWRRRGARVLAGVVTAGVVVLVAVPLSRQVPARDNGERVLLPRTAGPVEQPGQSNPLARVTAFQSGDDDLLFTAETSAPVARWRLAVLDRYDGGRWSGTGAYRASGRELPADPAPAAGDVEGEGAGSAERVAQTVEIVAPIEGGADGDLPWGRWLPLADRAVELSAGAVLFDAARGTAVVPTDRPVPDRYEVVSLVGEPDAGRLADAPAATGDAASAARRLPPDVPESLRTAARQVADGAGSDYAAAAAIQAWLMGERFRLVTVDPPGGHTLGHLDRFVRTATGGAAGGPAVGSVEQYVATFAVMARLAGLPSRVVVGFHGTGVAGSQEVRAHDATAWVEVELEGLGWVVFDPVPAVEGFVPDTGDREVDADEASGAPPPDALADADADDGERGAGGGRSTGTIAGAWLRRAGLLLAALALGALVVPGVVRGVRRARRRRAASPSAAVVGSWRTAADELRVAGIDTSPARAVSDVVGEGRERLGAVADPLVPLGALVNRCRYAAGAAATDEQARRAWALCDAFVAARRRGRPVGQRLREHVGVASRSDRVGST